MLSYVSLREPAVLPIPGWNKGQAHGYSTFHLNDTNLPGLSLVKDGDEISILKDGVKVAGVPLSNCRGYVYEQVEILDATLAEEPSAEPEQPSRRRRG